MEKFKKLSRTEMKSVVGGTGGSGCVAPSTPCSFELNEHIYFGNCSISIGQDCGCNSGDTYAVDNAQCKIPG